MPRKKLPYREGDWFAVPLGTGGYGLGLVARMNGSGIVIGYFFGLQYEHVPTLNETKDLSPADAVLLALFGDLGLLRQEWPIVGYSDPWDRNKWPLPVFGSIAADGSWAERVVLPEEDVGQLGHRIPTSVEEAKLLPRVGLYGYGAVETYLTELLTSHLKENEHP